MPYITAEEYVEHILSEERANEIIELITNRDNTLNDIEQAKRELKYLYETQEKLIESGKNTESIDDQIDDIENFIEECKEVYDEAISDIEDYNLDEDVLEELRLISQN